MPSDLLLPGAAVALLALLLLYAGLQLSAYLSVRHSSIPTLLGYIPILGYALHYASRGVGLLHDLSCRYGGIFRLRLAGRVQVFITDIEQHAAVYRDSANFNFAVVEDEITSRVVRLPTCLVGPANDWKVHSFWIRRLQGAGLESCNSALATGLTSHLLEAHASDLNWSTVRARAWSSSSLFSVGATVVFGPTLRVTPSLFADLNSLDAAFPLLVAGAPSFMTSTSDAPLARLIAEVKRHGTEDFASASDLIRDRVTHFKSAGLDDDAIAAVNVLTLWALHSNTAPVLFWLLAYLTHDASAYTALRVEVDAACDGSGAWWGVPSGLTARLDALHGITSAVQETMRMCGTSASMRQLTADSEVGGHKLTRGERVILLSTHHRDPRVFAEPETFKYDRFLPMPDGSPRVFTTPDGRPLRNPVAAFGGGVSMCPGRFLALNEIRLFLVLALRFLDIEAVPGAVIPAQDTSRTGLGMLPPVADMDIRIRWRGIPVPV